MSDSSHAFTTVLGSLVPVSPLIKSFLTITFPRAGNEMQEKEKGFRPKLKWRNSPSPVMYRGDPS